MLDIKSTDDELVKIKYHKKEDKENTNVAEWGGSRQTNGVLCEQWSTVELRGIIYFVNFLIRQ